MPATSPDTDTYADAMTESVTAATNPHSALTSRIPLLLLYFFLSGAAGLIYQVAWTKSLGLLFGYSAYATATVLAVFMGGLALGGSLLGKWCDARNDSIAIYGWIELGVAACGALSLVCLAAVRSLYLHAYPSLEHFALLKLALRFIAAAIVLVVPTFLMGGTLPILARGVLRHSSGVGIWVSRLYAVNTLGAVLGTLAAGFFLLPALGLRLTVAIAVIFNLIAGAGALLFARNLQRGTNSTAANTSPKNAKSSPSKAPIVGLPGTLSIRFLLISFGVVGASAIAYEVSWSRLLATTLGSSTYAFTIMLATFLAGMALGSLIFERWLSRGRTVTVTIFAATQAATALAALLFLISFQRLPSLVPLIHSSFVGLLLAQFLTSALAILPAAFLFGVNFPAVVTLIARPDGHVSNAVGRAYAANTFGAILGALITGFILVPRVGSYRVVALAGLANLVLAIVLELRSSRRPLVFALHALLFVALIAVGSTSWFYSRSLASFSAVLYRASHDTRLTPTEVANLEDVVFFEDGINATISVTRSEDYVSIKTNGKTDASNLDESTQLLLGDLGAIFHPHPRRVLIIGFGSGMTASAVARFPDVEEIDCVEIEPAVLHAQSHLTRLNRNVLADPRLHVILDDARNVIQTQRGFYDLIISEPSNPWIAGVASLYTDEFYAALRQRLAPDGIFVQWVQAYALQLDDFRMILASLSPHFADVSLWHSANRDFLILARTNSSPLTFNRARLIWSHPQLQKDFRSLHLTRPEGWPVFFRLSDSQVRSFATGAPINSDDRTLLEYRVPKALLLQTPGDPLDVAIVNRYGLSPVAELAAVESTAAMQATAESAVDLSSPLAGYYVSALPPSTPSLELLRGRIYLQQGHFADAKIHFEAASHASPNSYDAKYWLAIADHSNGDRFAGALLKEVLAHDPYNLEALRQEVALASDNHDWQTAIATQHEVLLQAPDSPALEYCRLGDFYLRSGNGQDAVAPFREGLRRDPYSFLCHREQGELLRITGRLPEAIQDLEFVVKYFPQADAKTYVSLALAYSAKQRNRDAEEISEKGRRIFPGDEAIQRFRLPH